MSTGPNYCSWLLNVQLPCCSCQVVSLAKGRPNLFVTNCECCFVNLITGFWLAPVDRYRITHNAPDRDRTCTIIESPDFESGASTSSATGAKYLGIGLPGYSQIHNIVMRQTQLGLTNSRLN